jgi:hypothetical protein
MGVEAPVGQTATLAFPASPPFVFMTLVFALTNLDKTFV